MTPVNRSLAERIDAVLPQTQCAKCGFAGCRPYAEGIALGQADINQCPPGGAAVIRRLALLLDRPYKPLNPANGVELPLRVALIDEPRCIGCTLCIQACPVDAIAGGARHMHTVIAELCTGCELCVAPCPADCIDLVPATSAWTTGRADAARGRFKRRQQRLAAEKTAATPPAREPELVSSSEEKRAAVIRAAVARARARRGLHAAPRSDES